MPLPIDPVTGIKIIGAVGKLFSGSKKRKAQRRARAARANIEKVRNRQSKRRFLQGFRQAQAAALVEGVATGAGLESSGVQGTLASQRTQAQFGAFEQNVQADQASVAGAQLNKADRAGFAADIVGTAAAVGSELAKTFPTSGEET